MKFISISQRLSFRIACGLLTALLVVGIPFFAFFYRFHRNQLIESKKASSTILGRLVLDTLEGRMLESRPHLIGADMGQLSTRTGVQRIMILNSLGEVRISSDPVHTGRVFREDDPSCSACHDKSPPMSRSTTIITKGASDQVFRTIIPIDNKPACYRCHEPSQRINGLLMIDLPFADAERQLTSGMEKMLGLGAIMIVVTILALGASLNRVVIRRLQAFSKTTAAIRKGNLDERVDVAGDDEISDLAKSFNVMTSGLKESLREIRRQKEYLESVINSIDDEIVVVDNQFRIVTANNAFLAKSGHPREDIIGQGCYVLNYGAFVPCNQSEGKHCPAKLTISMGTVNKQLYRHKDKEGNEKYVEIHCYPMRDEAGQVHQAIEVRRDITERRYLEASLSHAERLASLGLLASGLSHEINNPLASISACTEGLGRRLTGHLGRDGSVDEEEIREYIELVHKEAMRAKAITDRLLILSRKSASPTYLVSINQALDETVSLVRFQAEEKNIQITQDFDPDIPLIKADDPALRQVFLNLLLNAIQAIEGSGRIHVRTRLEPAQIRITFEDSGCGIPEEDLARLFEPFFSRKSSGQGTGLGLFISHTLIRQLGGTLSARSRVGRGTEFSVVLPIQEED